MHQGAAVDPGRPFFMELKVFTRPVRASELLCNYIGSDDCNCRENASGDNLSRFVVAYLYWEPHQTGLVRSLERRCSNDGLFHSGIGTV
jgi:hypothetical protein